VDCIKSSLGVQTIQPKKEARSKSWSWS